ncbi:MAG: peptidylprolyl isomerase, partial [Phycisphaerae bacterium]
VAAPARGGAEAERPPTGPEREGRYEARLDEVPLPVPPSPTPLVAAEENGQVWLADTILAEVNDEVITREDIFGPLRPQIRQWRRDLAAEEFDARCRAVADLKLREAISERLVIQEAKRRLSDAQKEELDATMGQILKDLVAGAGSRLLLEERLEAEGSTIEQTLERQRERILVQRFLRERIAPTVHVTHSELLDYYKKVRDGRYVEPTRIRLRLIMIRQSESPDAAQARALADAVHRRALAGEDFAKLAERYSRDVMADKGGDWGYVTEGSFGVREVGDVLFALQMGQVGPLVETADAFYLVKAEDRKEGRTVPFTEVQAGIEQEILDARYNEMVSRYIQDLYRKSYVRVRPENL